MATEWGGLARCLVEQWVTYSMISKFLGAMPPARQSRSDGHSNGYLLTLSLLGLVLFEPAFEQRDSGRKS